MNLICHFTLSKSMKHYLRLLMYPLLACIYTVSVFAAEEQPQLASGKPQNGVFFTHTGYMTTVLELKDGHFRYWFNSDAKLPQEPNYPLVGEYTISGNTITLKHEQVSQKQWTFRTVNGFITLWRPDAMDYKPDTKFDITHLKNVGAGSILTLTEKKAEEAWYHCQPKG